MRKLFFIIVLFFSTSVMANNENDIFDTICFLEGYPEKTLKYNTSVHEELNFYKDDIIIEENGVRQTLEYSWTHEPTSDIYTLVYRNPDTEHYIEGTIVYTYEYYFSNMKGSLSIGHDDGIDSKYSCEVIN